MSSIDTPVSQMHGNIPRDGNIQIVEQVQLTSASLPDPEFSTQSTLVAKANSTSSLAAVVQPLHGDWLVVTRRKKHNKGKAAVTEKGKTILKDKDVTVLKSIKKNVQLAINSHALVVTVSSHAATKDFNPITFKASTSGTKQVKKVVVPKKHNAKENAFKAKVNVAAKDKPGKDPISLDSPLPFGKKRSQKNINEGPHMIEKLINDAFKKIQVKNNDVSEAMSVGSPHHEEQDHAKNIPHTQ
ncbi:putative trafficking protein particle complex subunit 10 [Sesbania bispinosa]|nr:putative trafficking protein particle complex subunit 10 [Sesbania bispinosa]